MIRSHTSELIPKYLQTSDCFKPTTKTFYRHKNWYYRLKLVVYFYFFLYTGQQTNKQTTITPNKKKKKTISPFSVIWFWFKYLLNHFLCVVYLFVSLQFRNIYTHIPNRINFDIRNITLFCELVDTWSVLFFNLNEWNLFFSNFFLDGLFFDTTNRNKPKR